MHLNESRAELNKKICPVVDGASGIPRYRLPPCTACRHTTRRVARTRTVDVQHTQDRLKAGEKRMHGIASLPRTVIYTRASMMV